MRVKTVNVPIPEDRKKKYEATEKAQVRRRKYMHGTRKTYRRNKSEYDYLSRPFRAWDGEGGDETDGSHTYFLFASSDGHAITERGGLSTKRVFELLLHSSDDDCINVIYGGNYDANMILRDLPREHLEELYATDITEWQGYRIEWRPGKYFRVSDDDRRITVYDVLPFFQRTFVSACDEYLGTNYPYREEIIAGKKRRGTFDWSQIDYVAEYCSAELQNLVSLANELRERLYRVNIRVSRWDGPGAIASSLYKTYDTKSYFGEIPDAVATAGRHGYAGGRFEIIRKGHSERKAYQYDLNSAYPYSIAQLPCLAHGRWVHVKEPVEIEKFGIYRIEYDASEECDAPVYHPAHPQPFYMRMPDGAVSYPMYAHGWYWSPEASISDAFPNSRVHEGWVYRQECDHIPFSWVEALYNKRAALKKAKDGAHIGIKLGLNSLYGKLAQQVGWRLDPTKGLVIPPYHSLEWAGWITSMCRMKVYEAALKAPDDIIAFETDAVFSRVPLDLPLSSRLGEWEETVYTSLTYIKSGMYYGTLEDGTPVEKSRGINKGSITRNDAIGAMSVDATLPAEQTRFIGLGQALHQNFDIWRHWVTAPRNISTLLGGKRRDTDSRIPNLKELHDGWRETVPVNSPVGFSQPYSVAWINPTDNDWSDRGERWADNSQPD